MPIPKTWVEELVVEWLHIDGFLVESNLPVGTTEVGGRNEADVVGAKMDNNTLVIRHVEVGQFSGGVKGVESVLSKKFSQSIQNSIKDYFKQRLSFTSDNIKYDKFYVLTYWTGPTIEAEALKRYGVIPLPLPDFIQDNVIPSIQRWKENPPHGSRLRGEIIGLPETYWLLQLIDYMYNRRMLNIEKLISKQNR